MLRDAPPRLDRHAHSSQRLPQRTLHCLHSSCALHAAIGFGIGFGPWPIVASMRVCVCAPMCCGLAVDLNPHVGQSLCDTVCVYFRWAQQAYRAIFIAGPLTLGRSPQTPRHTWRRSKLRATCLPRPTWLTLSWRPLHVPRILATSGAMHDVKPSPPLNSIPRGCGQHASFSQFVRVRVGVADLGRIIAGQAAEGLQPNMYFEIDTNSRTGAAPPKPRQFDQYARDLRRRHK